MIPTLVSTITSAFARPSFIAFGAALFWGILSVLLSPCHLGTIPLIVAYINNGKRPDKRKAFWYSLLFTLGLMVMLFAIGVVTSIAGRLMGDVGSVLPVLVAIFLILCGLWLMDVPPLNRLTPSFSVHQKSYRGTLGALILGLVYGIILGPCSFAFLAPMLGFVFAASSNQIAYGIALILLYALGHGSVIIAAGTFGDFLSSMLQKRGAHTIALWFKRVLGGIVIIAGILQIIH